METQNPISFNPRVPRELKMFIEMIQDVFAEFDSVKWSTKSDIEIGFYFRNKKKKTEYFFGIWYDLWEKFGIPLSLVLSYDGKAPVQWKTRVNKFIANNFEERILIREFGNYTCLLFDYNYFKFDKGNDSERLSELYYQITEYSEAIVED